MSEDHSRDESSTDHAGSQVRRQDFEMAKAIRTEAFSYLTKIVFAGVATVVAALVAALWGYFEWRIPQIAGGVPSNAVMAFEQENCPSGWMPYAKGVMRTIVGAAPNTEATDNTYPRHLYYNEQRGEYGEYLLTKATRDNKQTDESEQRVFTPGVVALTYCKKTHEQ